MDRLATISIDRESHKFSAAHFTIFSATERERLHGHNFSVSARIVAPVDGNGMTGDYAVYKRAIKRLCDGLDEYTLIPSLSPHLKIEEQGDYYNVTHNGDTLPLLKSDTLLLPVRNTTVEELSRYLLETLVADRGFLEAQRIQEVEVLVSSGPGQSGSCVWSR